VLTDDNFVMYKTTPTELQSFFGGTGVWTRGLVMLAKQALYHFNHSASLSFVMDFFEIGSQELSACDWCQTAIPLISAFWVARIIGVSLWGSVELYSLRMN
jgi:hypothetical protein